MLNTLNNIASCGHQWQESTQQVTNLAGKTVAKHYFRDENTGELYGHTTGDSSSCLRKKFLGAFLIQIPVVLLLRIPSRVVAILSGDFVRSGCEKARNEWKNKMQQWSLDPNVEVSPPRFYSIVLAKHILWQLTKNVAKVVTYPLALVGMVFVSVYGLFAPVTARALYGAIESAWSRDSTPSSGRSREICQSITVYKVWLHINEFIGPCFQTKAVWEKNNLYRQFHDYDENTLRSLLLKASNKLNADKEFLAKEGVDIAAMQAKIVEYQKQIKELCHNEAEEFRIIRDDDIDKERILKLREELIGFYNHFETLETSRAITVETQLDSYRRTRYKS